MGARLVFDMYRRCNTILLNEESVLRAKKRYNSTSKPRYTLLDLGDVRRFPPTRLPPATMSFPCCMYRLVSMGLFDDGIYLRCFFEE